LLADFAQSKCTTPVSVDKHKQIAPPKMNDRLCVFSISADRLPTVYVRVYLDVQMHAGNLKTIDRGGLDAEL